MKPNRLTKRWIKNASDERAVSNGCSFDESRGQFVVDWLETCLCLYEGEMAGHPFKCMEWQRDFLMRLFGWVRPSERWQKKIRRFREAGLWVPKKNGKSPLLAGLGLYLMCGDSEPGQQVYFAAKDGAQARKGVGRHAIEMCQASPLMMGECTINKSLLQITHEETRSILYPLSASDKRTQKAKEGLNGSVLVDETHVVDREFMNRISRAGISRIEPLLVEVSTAGDDPDSYGRERYDYGKMVERGDKQDDRFLFMSYEAPAELNEIDLDADPWKYGEAANPSSGITVSREEFLDDYNSSKASISKLNLFKMYRLNVWQASANPWLRQSDWIKNSDDYDWESLRGKPCWLGLDLAKVHDTTAIVAVFPPDEADGEYQLWPKAYLPQQAADDVAGIVPYRDWERRGDIELTEGDVCDYEFVRAGLNWFRDTFSVQGLGYDPYFADVLIQRLSEDDGWDVSIMKEFPQTIMHFAGPTEEFERLVIARRMRHPNNRLLNWQAGHCTVRTDVNRNKRPVKPKHGDHRTIDLCVAGIMALGLAMQADPPMVYEKRGVPQIGVDESLEACERAVPVLLGSRREFNWQELD